MTDLVVPRLYSCCKCGNHLCLHDHIIDKHYLSAGRRAFLFYHAMNIVIGPKRQQRLISGIYTIADVNCSNCGELLGWKYHEAHEEQFKFKEGKLVIGKFKINKENW